MSAELHLFIVWHNRPRRGTRNCFRARAQFTILDVCDVCWSEHHFSENMSRFYGHTLPPGSHKEKHCGRGPFRLFIVLDARPSYERRTTWSGVELVNARTLMPKNDAVDLLAAAIAFQRHEFFSAEAAHDLMLLLGTTPEKVLAEQNATWDGVVRPLSARFSWCNRVGESSGNGSAH